MRRGRDEAGRTEPMGGANAVPLDGVAIPAVSAMPYRAVVIGIPKEYDHYPFKTGEIVRVLAEVDGMPGHFVIELPDGRTISGYHDDFLRPLGEDEVDHA